MPKARKGQNVIFHEGEIDLMNNPKEGIEVRTISPSGLLVNNESSNLVARSALR